ncbi:MAG: hypothetical protein M1832_003650 [Thelocarpon impressellum]|nr:MAG: hypothetical protein M1832_003650 [Thelocarpon impressellum]
MGAQHNIVVLGGSFAGLGVAHYLLRHTVPDLTAAARSGPTYKVIVVSTSTHLYWTVGAPRAIVGEKLLPLNKEFTPITDGFKGYPPGSFEFLHAEAIQLDPAKRTVSLKPLAASPDAPAVLDYGTLVIATGTTSTSALWSASGGHDKTLAAYKEVRAAIPTAESILVAGGGPAGVETAAELAFEFRKTKDITLLSGSTKLLGGVKSDIGTPAEKVLRNLGATVRHNVRVSASRTLPSGKTQLTLSDGSSLTVDLFIDATGLRPSTSFLPGALRDARGAVLTDEATLRVTGAGERVYALGSVASFSKGGLLDVWNPIPALAANLAYDVSAGAVGAERTYKSAAETMIVPVGRSKGVGVVYGWSVPSLVVWALKGRDYLVGNLVQERDGAKWVKRA